MEKLIEETALELWKSINQLDKTFNWQLNWFLHKKVEKLWKMLDDLLELQKQENNLIK